MPDFFKVVTPEQVFDFLSGFHRMPAESVALEQALGRVLAEDALCAEDMPPAARSTMDGFAVRAADTFGASDAVPALLAVRGRVLMGETPDFEVAKGCAADIPTGGFLPRGADAVVMVEYTARISDDEIEVTRPVTAGENVLLRAGDVASGEIVLRRGQRLRPQDIGMLAALGAERVTVHKRPAAAVISTGDEIVPVTETPAPGQIRDSNTYGVSAIITAAGAVPQPCGIVKDEASLLRDTIAAALNTADLVVISGGSSVGERDHMLGVMSSFGDSEIFAHGVAISPGKPALFSRIGDKPVIGLPGHPVSALIVAQVFVSPFLKFLEGEDLSRRPAGQCVRATLATPVHSPHGREDFVRVKLDGRSAVPVFGKSGMLSTLVNADGFFVIPMHSEGVPDGETVEVFLF
jgi:molybdopterin molybdotransferase